MVQRIGLVVVHGIGEQKPGDHLETVVRPLAKAMRDLRWRVTIEETQDEKAREHGRPTVTLHVDTRAARNVPADPCFLIGVHEVHWADINEASSIGKGLRFWLWGLGAWAMPRYRWPTPEPKAGETPHPQAVMMAPKFPDGRKGPLRLRDRLQLFLTGWVFGTLAIVLQAVQWIARKLFDTKPWPIVTLIVNYVSAVKIYTQPRRHGSGFLAHHLEPPRFTIRRRMVEAIVDAALIGYDRWYVLAHSQGSVVAYNGLTATGAAIANHLSEERFARLAQAHCRHTGQTFLAALPADALPPTLRVSRPAAPVQRRDRRTVNRSILFTRFAGLVTYGSPLDKYAAIWPGTVSVNTQPNFGGGVRWLNFHDPVDPVSGCLDAFDHGVPEGAAIGTVEVPFRPENRVFGGSWTLLVSHLRYLQTSLGSPTELAFAIAQWITKVDEAKIDAIDERVDLGARKAAAWACVVLVVVLQVLFLWAVGHWLVPTWIKDWPFVSQLTAWGDWLGGFGYVLVWTFLVVVLGIVGALFTEQDPEDVWVGETSTRYTEPPTLLRVLIDRIRSFRSESGTMSIPKLTWIRLLLGRRGSGTR